MSQVLVYGIPNCGSVKNARTWLDQHDIAYQFHDFKKAGLDAATVAHWLQSQPWETLVNRKGQTWRGLSDAQKAAVHDAASATELMLSHTSVIKRPVIDYGGKLIVGYLPEQYAQVFL
jgi:arsenate reductase